MRKLLSRTSIVELIAWTGGLVFLACIDPFAGHFTVCPIKNLGYDFCPGCGLGTSIALLFRGDVAQSLHAHPLGVFALPVIIQRIITLSIPLFTHQPNQPQKG